MLLTVYLRGTAEDAQMTNKTYTRSRGRLIALGLLAVLAMLAPLLLGGGTASAQTSSVTLVSNTGQSNNPWATPLDRDWALAFTTGHRASGYTLTSIELESTRGASAAVSHTATIRSGSGTNVGASVGRCRRPACSLPGRSASHRPPASIWRPTPRTSWSSTSQALSPAPRQRTGQLRRRTKTPTRRPDGRLGTDGQLGALALSPGVLRRPASSSR